MSRSNGKSPSGDEEAGEPLPPTDLNPPEDSDSLPARKKRKRRPKSVSLKSTGEAESLAGPVISSVTGAHNPDSPWKPWPIWLVPLPALMGLVAIAGLVWFGWKNTQTAPKVLTLDSLVLELPSHLDRQRFLDEVKYLGNVPGNLEIDKEDHRFRLKAALGKHPWVRSVDTLEVTPNGLEARVVFRKPVLMVPVDPALSSGGNFRLVDEAGVLLPVLDQTSFPKLEAAVPGPAGEPGQLWGNPTVEQAAALAGWLARQSPPVIPQVIRGASGKWMFAWERRWVIWNEGPESQSQGHSTAKLARLKQLAASTPEGSSINVSDVPAPR